MSDSSRYNQESSRSSSSQSPRLRRLNSLLQIVTLVYLINDIVILSLYHKYISSSILYILTIIDAVYNFFMFVTGIIIYCSTQRHRNVKVFRGDVKWFCKIILGMIVVILFSEDNSDKVYMIVYMKIYICLTLFLPSILPILFILFTLTCIPSYHCILHLCYCCCVRIDIDLPIPNTVLNGLDDEELSKLPVYKYTNNSVIDSSGQIIVSLTSDDAVCIICHEMYPEDGLIRKLDCGHHFDKMCIDKWLRLHNSCPNCRYEIIV